MTFYTETYEEYGRDIQIDVDLARRLGMVARLRRDIADAGPRVRVHSPKEVP